ncbi:MAG: LytTR family transcriptional regulator [Tissierellia bacterium]|nr:LytTR family transcriptional regulator [Tissierellia bacterium]
MKIRINIDPDLKEDEVIINCRNMTDEIERLIATLRVSEEKLTGNKDEHTFMLKISEVLYIDTIDRRVFLYTSEDVYETQLKLYELEEMLSSHDFFRASKSSIVSLRHIKSLKTDLGGRLIVSLYNGEKLTVSRQYAINIKNRLGV